MKGNRIFATKYAAKAHTRGMPCAPLAKKEKADGIILRADGSDWRRDGEMAGHHRAPDVSAF